MDWVQWISRQQWRSSRMATAITYRLHIEQMQEAIADGLTFLRIYTWWGPIDMISASYITVLKRYGTFIPC